MIELTQEIVRELLDYDADTGKFHWKFRDVKWFADTGHGGAEGECKRWNGKNAGKEAFATPKRGYLSGLLFAQAYQTHRMA